MPRAVQWEMAAAELRDLLGELIAVDTSNPPGNELAAARVLQARLERERIPCTLLEAAPGRGNLVARLTGSGARPPMLVMGHLDVVPVQRERWETDPFVLTERDGALYGRGVIDDKGMTAAAAMALVLLGRAGIQLARDVILLAEADEEVGGQWGISWMLEHHPDLVAAEFAVNEGGRVNAEGGVVRWVGLQNAEKRPMNVKLVAHGSAGHASMPRPDNPLLVLSRALMGLAAEPFPVALTDETRRFFPEIAGRQPDPEMAAAMRRIVEPAHAAEAARVLDRDLMYGAMIRHTISPTMLAAGIKANVIPSRAEAVLNVRMLPGTDPAAVVAEIRRRLPDPAVEAVPELPHRPEAPSSRFAGPLVDAVRAAATARFPGAPVVPFLATGATDSAMLRERGVPAYGLLVFPLDVEDTGRMHSDGERMPVASLGAGLHFLHDVIAAAAC